MKNKYRHGFHIIGFPVRGASLLRLTVCLVPMLKQCGQTNAAYFKNEARKYFDELKIS